MKNSLFFTFNTVSSVFQIQFIENMFVQFLRGMNASINVLCINYYAKVPTSSYIYEWKLIESFGIEKLRFFVLGDVVFT